MFNRNDMPDDAFAIIKDDHKLLRHHDETVKDGSDNVSAIPYLVDFGLNMVDDLPLSDAEKQQVTKHLQFHRDSKDCTNEIKKEMPTKKEGKSESKEDSKLNDLPDEAFAVIENGKNSSRHLPYKNSEGEIDLPNLRNALACMDRIEAVNKEDSTERIRAVAKRKLTDAVRTYLPNDKFSDGEFLGAKAKIINVEKQGEKQYIDVVIEVGKDGPQVSIPFDVIVNKDGKIEAVRIYWEVIPGVILEDVAKFLKDLSKDAVTFDL